ncbi:MAG: hypothetical protein GC181_15655 [Bacteroidetes bacterium]|nr:hypothetical protein [Bacteroidota bacterium]
MPQGTKVDEPNKFKLEGEILTQRESTYEKDELKRQLRNRNITLITGSVLLLISFVTVGFLFFRLSEQGKQIQQLEVLQMKADSLGRKLKLSKQHNDSLELRNAMMQHQNDLLAENSQMADGIFFDVMIGGFEDFNLDAYMRELSEIRNEEYNGEAMVVIGRFRSFKKALLYENDLKTIGLKNVKLVGRIDGKLVPYKVAHEALSNQK